MRVVVVGATGNKGSRLVRRLAADDRVDSVVGVARRRPELTVPKTSWISADITRVDLEPVLAGADAVVHLAWLIQPSHDERPTHAVNVEGSRRVFDAAARAGVPAIVYASSIGAYSPGPKDRRVDESWPTEGLPTSFYARHKASVERILDSFEAAHPDVRVVRLRPGIVMQRAAASQIRRLFAGPFLPSPLLRRALVPVVPLPDGLRIQVVHAEDAAAAYHAAVVRDVHGAFNIAAEPVLDREAIGEALGARTVGLPGGVLRAAAHVTWRLRLQPTDPGWVDMGLNVPLMDTARARAELGWEPRKSALETFNELFDGMRESAGDATPPLAPGTGGPLRVRELLTGIGQAPR